MDMTRAITPAPTRQSDKQKQSRFPLDKRSFLHGRLPSSVRTISQFVDVGQGKVATLLSRFIVLLKARTQLSSRKTFLFQEKPMAIKPMHATQPSSFST